MFAAALLIKTPTLMSFRSPENAADTRESLHEHTQKYTQNHKRQ